MWSWMWTLHKLSWNSQINFNLCVSCVPAVWGQIISIVYQTYFECHNCIKGRHNWFTLVWLCCSVAQLCLTLWDPMDCSMPGFPVLHYLLKVAWTHVHCVSDAVQSSHSLLSLSPPAFNLSQYQGLFQWVGALHQVAKALEFQLQHQSFQWTPRTDLL